MSELKPSNNSKATRYVKIGEASEILSVSIDTLRRWEKAGKIETIRTPGGTRLYKVKTLEKIQQKKSSRSAKKITTPTSAVLPVLSTSSAPVTLVSQDLPTTETINTVASNPVEIPHTEEIAHSTVLNTSPTTEETPHTPFIDYVEPANAIVLPSNASVEDISVTDYIGKYHNWESELPKIEPMVMPAPSTTFSTEMESAIGNMTENTLDSSSSEKSEIYADLASNNTPEQDKIYADLASNKQPFASKDDVSYPEKTDDDYSSKDSTAVETARGFRPKMLGHFSASSLKNKKVGGVFATLLLFFISSFLLVGNGMETNRNFLSFLGTQELNGSKDVAEVLAESTISKFNKYLEINADTSITGNLAVEGQGIFREEVTAPNLVYGIVAGTNITISGDPQNPTISATGTAGIAAETDTLASVTARGATTTTLLQLAGGLTTTNLTLSNALSLGNLGSDPSTASNGTLYYNTSSNKLRCLLSKLMVHSILRKMMFFLL